MNRFTLFVAICLAAARAANLLDENCEVLNLTEGDVHNDFIHLSSLKNEKRGGELFRYTFFYNYTKDDYLFKMFLTKASNVKELDAQNNYWVIELSDTFDDNVGYSTLTDQNFKIIDKSESKLKLYGKGLVGFEVVLTEDKELKVVQPGKKEAYLRSSGVELPLYKFAGVQFSGGNMSFYYDCEE